MRLEKFGQTPKVLVVISFYDARDENSLDILLGQLQEIPAGLPFDTLVVVNSERSTNCAMEEKYKVLRFVYRPNIGYNLGAWDHGWRSALDYEAYAFLQDDCLIAKAGWLSRLVRKATAGKGALVGEDLVSPAQSWDESHAECIVNYTRRGYDPNSWGAGGNLSTPETIRSYFRQQGFLPLPTMVHLRALALCAPIRLLKEIDGFPSGATYREAVGSEVLISQRALRAGFALRQAGFLPYSNIIHPQWMAARSSTRTLKGMVRQSARALIPLPIRRHVYQLKSRRFASTDRKKPDPGHVGGRFEK
jgi:hypothetical protein